MPDKPVPLTKEGLAKLEKELDHLQTVRRQEVAARIHQAKELASTQNNAEYEDAKKERAFGEGGISNESPVGRGLMGKGIGAAVLVEAPAGTIRLTITNIA